MFFFLGKEVQKQLLCFAKTIVIIYLQNNKFARVCKMGERVEEAVARPGHRGINHQYKLIECNRTLQVANT